MKLDPQGLGQGPGGAHHLGLRPDELVTRLRKIGVTPGSTLMFHSSWRPHNGFRASPPMWCAPSRPRWGRAACW
jgi:hypothetical protein